MYLLAAFLNKNIIHISYQKSEICSSLCDFVNQPQSKNSYMYEHLYSLVTRCRKWRKKKKTRGRKLTTYSSPEI